MEIMNTGAGKVGRPIYEGNRCQFIVADDVQEWIKAHGGGKYITDTMRTIRNLEESKDELFIADDVRKWIMSQGGSQYLNKTMRMIMAVASGDKKE